ncbi:hypothetical protein GCM10010430_60470 [Kitasatospora cystarginea]|uniref:Uncharacterized protein n=1 Tax=Kitasatospora cystarginea TaxID=58350 RepID=A0ABP5RR58_9ACTN
MGGAHRTAAIRRPRPPGTAESLTDRTTDRTNHRSDRRPAPIPPPFPYPIRRLMENAVQALRGWTPHDQQTAVTVERLPTTARRGC